MNEFSLYDTASQEAKLVADKAVGIYFCGPTVYDRVHIGNARPFVVFSVMRNLLVHLGHDVTLVSNITDINDKIYHKSQQEKEHSQKWAQKMEKFYIQDTDALNLGRPDIEPKATAYIPEIIQLISKLIENGKAYVAHNDVYFRVSSDLQHGMISHRHNENSVSHQEPNKLKEHPEDFTLWKSHKTGEDTWWDSPWGKGRPGWHIECSAMAEATLGLNFQIHGGGNDLVFPHHENEASQTRSAHNIELSQIWAHTGMLLYEGQKMSKSQGNIISLKDAINQYSSEAIVWWFLNSHYRKPIDFSSLNLTTAVQTIEKIKHKSKKLVDGKTTSQQITRYKEQFFQELKNDFNTPQAIFYLQKWINEAKEGEGNSQLREMLNIFGLSTILQSTEDIPSQEIEYLAQQRDIARQQQNWEQADILRNQIKDQGWQIKDQGDTSTLHKLK